MQGLVKTLHILREWSLSDTITSTWGDEVRGSGSLCHSVIGQELRLLGGLPNDWSNLNAHIFWYPGKSFVNLVSYDEPGKYKLQPYELCFHCHVSDSQKVTVLCKEFTPLWSWFIHIHASDDVFTLNSLQNMVKHMAICSYKLIHLQRSRLLRFKLLLWVSSKESRLRLMENQESHHHYLGANGRRQKVRSEF